MGQLMTFTGVMVKVKGSIMCARTRQVQNTFVTGIVRSKVLVLSGCDTITKSLATFADCFSKDFTPYILRCVFRFACQFGVQLPTLKVALRTCRVFIVYRCVCIPWTWYQRKPESQCRLWQSGSSSQAVPGGATAVTKPLS